MSLDAEEEEDDNEVISIDDDSEREQPKSKPAKRPKPSPAAAGAAAAAAGAKGKGGRATPAAKGRGKKAEKPAMVIEKTPGSADKKRKLPGSMVSRVWGVGGVLGTTHSPGDLSPTAAKRGAAGKSRTGGNWLMVAFTVACCLLCQLHVECWRAAPPCRQSHVSP